MHIIDNDQVTSKRRRRDHSPELKRQLVERALKPGASVAAIALEAGINANLLFTWRREQRDATATVPAAALLPVNVEEPVTSAAQAAPPRSPSGTIEIDIGRARVRLRGVVDDDNMRCVLQTLSTLA
jgi:transposase